MIIALSRVSRVSRRGMSTYFGGAIARRLLARGHEQRLEGQVDQVSKALQVLEKSQTFKRLQRKANLRPVDVRQATRALLCSPVGVDQVHQALELHYESDRDLLHNEHLISNIVDLLSTFRPHQHAEIEADLSSPHTWFPLARSIERKIILHVGPTNSGKTHNAIRALHSAESGWYAGPLRLLAWEIFETLSRNRHGFQRGPVACNLLTGQEVERTPHATHTSSTVEMVDVNEVVDVGVIDEIQMIGCALRGWAWTRAVLGLPARELHLCGDKSAVEIIRRICECTGDELVVNEYERLSPLVAADKAVSNFSELQSGDCVVAFSKKEVFKLKARIERMTKFTCSMIYGGLPPETRRSQAEHFNNGTNQVLVATDAVGMGLNLRIGRVIMSSLRKFDGGEQRLLTPSETKQIVGRAGRFSSDFAEGQGAVMHRNDVPLLQEMLVAPVVPLQRAGLYPPREIVKAVARNYPNMSLYELLTRIETLRSTDTSLYFICDLEDMKQVSRMLQVIPDDALDLDTRWTFCIAPVQVDSREHMMTLKDYVLGYTYERVCRLPPWLVTRVRRAEVPSSREELAVLEASYGLLEVYLWLGNKLGEYIFQDMKEIIELRSHCCDLIDQGLVLIGQGKGNRNKRPGTFQKHLRDETCVTDAIRDIQSVIVKLEAARLAQYSEENQLNTLDPVPTNRQFF